MKTDPKRELKDFADALQDSDSPLHAIYESTRSIRFIIAQDYTVVFFNKKALEEFHYVFGIEITTGMSISNCFKNNNFTESLDVDFQKSLQGEHIIRDNLIGIGENKVWYKMDFHPLILENRTIAVSISIRNINDRKKKDLKIQEQNTLLNEIVFTLCHDIRGPVATILGLVNILDKSELSEKNKEIVGYLEIASNNLDKIITKVVSHIDTINLQE